MSLVRSAVVAALVLTPSLQAQSPALRQAARTITETDVRRRIELIAHDSMGGRDTPSPGLEATARYVAREFERLGLRPAGDAGGYIQRYPISVAEPDPDSSFLEFSRAGASFRLQIGRDIALRGSGPGTLTAYPVLLVTGAPDSAALAAADPRNALVVWVADWSRGAPAGWRNALAALQGSGAAGVLALVNNDSLAPPGPAGAGLAPLVAYGPPPATPPAGSGRFLALVNDALVAGRVPGAAERLTRLRAGPATVALLPDWRARAIQRQQPYRQVGAPNVVGILEGADPALRGEFVVISAHMDHVGSRCRGAGPADAICNGADDDASGTAGVVELAEAFAAAGARPARSLLFLTVSAEERGLWGSRYFAANPPVPVERMVANLNMDMIGRNWRDTVVAIGKAHSDLGATADRIAARHPELGLAVVDDLWPEENLYGRSDHFNFARRGVPVLFFTSGLHADYHAVTDTPDRIDAEKQARILQLVFYLAADLATRPERPRWNPASFDAIVGRK